MTLPPASNVFLRAARELLVRCTTGGFGAGSVSERAWFLRRDALAHPALVVDDAPYNEVPSEQLCPGVSDVSHSGRLDRLDLLELRISHVPGCRRIPRSGFTVTVSLWLRHLSASAPRYSLPLGSSALAMARAGSATQKRIKRPDPELKTVTVLVMDGASDRRDPLTRFGRRAYLTMAGRFPSGTPLVRARVSLREAVPRH
jgi:hypothetical protein